MSSSVRGSGGKTKIETEEKTVTAATTNKVVTPSEGKLLSKVTVQPTPTEEKIVTPTENQQIITPTSGKFLRKVTINAAPKQLAPFNACPDFNANNCEIGTMLCNALAYPEKYPSQVQMHLKIVHTLKKIVTFAVASNATKYTNSNGGFLGLNALYQKSCGWIATSVYNGTSYSGYENCGKNYNPFYPHHEGGTSGSEQGVPKNDASECWIDLGGASGVPDDWNTIRYAYIISAK